MEGKALVLLKGMLGLGGLVETCRPLPRKKQCQRESVYFYCERENVGYMEKTVTV